MTLTSHSCKPLYKSLVNIITPIIKRRGLAQASIILDWDKIVTKLANFCLPIKLKFPYQKRVDGTLHLWVDSGSALQLEYSKDLIIAKINTYFGYNAVAQLRFTQTSFNKSRANTVAPSPKILKTSPDEESSLNKDLSRHLNDIPCQQLREALIALGQSIRSI